MNTLLERPPGRGTDPSVDLPTTGAGPDVEQMLRVVDRGLHLGSLLLHAGLYALLGFAAARIDCGPHLLAGVLFGDFLGYALHSWPAFRRAPVAALAEYLLFAALFAWSWHRYSWPDQPEFRALFCLAGFGALTGRVGLFTARARVDDGWS